VRHEIADHPVLNPFLVPGVEVLQDNLANGLNRVTAILRKAGEILRNCSWFSWHATSLQDHEPMFKTGRIGDNSWATNCLGLEGQAIPET
jgi:hypothetical protein